MTPVRFSVATANGKSAIASVIVFGEDALQIARQVFRPLNRNVEIGESFDRVLYGNWIDEGKTGEDLILCPISPTQFEIHGHGSIAAIEIISQTLVMHGLVEVTFGEMASHLAGSEYFGDLIRTATLARTARTASLSMKQPGLHRILWAQVSEAVANNMPERAIAMLAEFLRWRVFGLHLTQSYQVVICGKPNVGKSSLVNAMLGFQRAIVHDVAGTTRDAVKEVTAIAGWPVEVVDTAGIRDSSDAVEQQGIAIAHQTLAAADLRLLVVDLHATDSQAVTQQINQHQPHLVIGNKSDLAQVCCDQIDLSVSATEKTNLNELMQLIADRLVPELPAASQPVPVSRYCVQQATELSAAIAGGEIELAMQKIARILGN